MEQRAALPSEVLGRQVKYWRERRKLTAQALANRAAELGATALTRAAISKIEVAQRGVSVDEWLQLAHVLAVPPPLLLFDLRSGEPVQIAPGAVLHPWLAWQWVVGEEPPIVTNRMVARSSEFADAKDVIHLYRHEAKAARVVQDARHDIRRAEFAGDQDALRAARTQYAEALRELARCLDYMVEHGIEPPGMPPEWLEAMLSLKLLKYPDRVKPYVPEDEPEDEPDAS